MIRVSIKNVIVLVLLVIVEKAIGQVSVARIGIDDQPFFAEGRQEIGGPILSLPIAVFRPGHGRDCFLKKAVATLNGLEIDGIGPPAVQGQKTGQDDEREEIFHFMLDPEKRRDKEHGETEIQGEEIAKKEPGAEAGKCIHPGKDDEKEEEDPARGVFPFSKGEIDEDDDPGQKKEQEQRTGRTAFVKKEGPDHIQSGF